MLQQLQIQNYALIQEMQINFAKGLNIITGETGAGKSILVGALSLVLGERADLTTLNDKNAKCIVEGIFKLPSQKVAEFLSEQELDQSDEVVVRREITPSGKSRAFINDTPVSLTQMKAFASLLVDLHQQFDTLELGDTGFQREAIDAIAGNAQNLDRYKIAYTGFINDSRRLAHLKSQKEKAASEYDYRKFLFDELEEANFSDNEIENAEDELKLLSSAEDIKEIILGLTDFLQNGEQPVISHLKTLNNKFLSLSTLHPGINELSKRIQSNIIDLQDIADELELLEGDVNYDPEKIERINERISEGYRLLKKHNVNTTGSLIEIKRDLERKLRETLDIDDEIISLEKQVSESGNEAAKLAEQLSSKRKAAAPDFEKKINQLLVQVGMPNARIRISIQTGEPLNEQGSDRIEFLFNANVPSAGASSAKFIPVKKVASGGELSRLMLGIKSILAHKMQLPTLIFDEIDSGISGEAAKKVGNIMKSLAENHQIISITHQPQIASKADAHFYVFKEMKQGNISTSIRLLTTDERIDTIATMLSGKKPSAAAFANAREMIEN